MTNYYKRPKKLAKGSMWISVAEIHRSDGEYEEEEQWGVEAIDFDSTEEAAKECAMDWYNDTGQSKECEVSFAVELPDGTIAGHRVKIKVDPQAEIVRTST